MATTARTPRRSRPSSTPTGSWTPAAGRPSRPAHDPAPTTPAVLSPVRTGHRPAGASMFGLRLAVQGVAVAADHVVFDARRPTSIAFGTGCSSSPERVLMMRPALALVAGAVKPHLP